MEPCATYGICCGVPIFIRFRPLFTSISITKRLIAFVVLLVLLVMLYAALTLQHSRSKYEARAGINSENLARLLSHHLVSSFEKIDLMLLGIKEEAERQMENNEYRADSLNIFVERELLRQPEVRFAQVADAFGNTSLASVAGVTDGPSLAKSEQFLRLQGDDDVGLLILSVSSEDLPDEHRTVVFARRINAPDGRFAGIVQANVTLDHFAHLFSTLHLGEHGIVNLRNQKLATVARIPQLGAQELNSDRAIALRLRQRIERSPEFATFFAVGRDGLGRVMTYQKLGDYPFYIVVGLYPTDFLSGWYAEVRNTLAMLLLFIVVAAVFARMMALAWLRREEDARRMEELSHRVVALQESERRILALELHDGASPNLAALKISLGLIQGELPSQVRQEVRPRFDDASHLLDEIAANLRDVCANLRPTMLDYSGLLPALEDYARNFSRDTAIQVQVSGSQAEQRLPANLESVLFRIAQEALTNAAKHARAKRIEIRLTRDDERVCLAIEDDGVGFDKSQVGKGKRAGLGLLTMRERAEFVGAQFDIESRPGRGTRITIEARVQCPESAPMLSALST